MLAPSRAGGEVDGCKASQVWPFQAQVSFSFPAGAPVPPKSRSIPIPGSYTMLLASLVGVTSDKEGVGLARVFTVGVTAGDDWFVGVSVLQAITRKAIPGRSMARASFCNKRVCLTVLLSCRSIRSALFSWMRLIPYPGLSLYMGFCSYILFFKQRWISTKNCRHQHELNCIIIEVTLKINFIRLIEKDNMWAIYP